MALTGSLDDDEYWPEFGTVVIRDKAYGRFEDDPDEDSLSPLLTETAGPLFGTVARAGNGWLHLNSGGQPQQVRIEAHDDAPPVETGAWPDVMETPYRSVTGQVALAMTTSGPWSSSPGLAIGAGLGRYRARVSRAVGKDYSDRWLVQFWPQQQRNEPAWLRRAPGRDGQTSAAWHRAVSLGEDLFAMVSWSGHGKIGTTVPRLAAELLVEPAAIIAALGDPEGAYLRLRGDLSGLDSHIRLMGFTEEHQQSWA